jgi:hypothetical protein
MDPDEAVCLLTESPGVGSHGSNRLARSGDWAEAGPDGTDERFHVGVEHSPDLLGAGDPIQDAGLGQASTRSIYSYVVSEPTRLSRGPEADFLSLSLRANVAEL